MDGLLGSLGPRACCIHSSTIILHCPAVSSCVLPQPLTVTRQSKELKPSHMYTHTHTQHNASLGLESSISRPPVAHDFLLFVPRVRRSLHVWGGANKRHCLRLGTSGPIRTDSARAEPQTKHVQSPAVCAIHLHQSATYNCIPQPTTHSYLMSMSQARSQFQPQPIFLTCNPLA
jgi:hypothetical protein